MKEKTDAAEQKVEQKQHYTKPTTKKHEPVKVVQGSSSCALYYTSLYYY